MEGAKPAAKRAAHDRDVQSTSTLTVGPTPPSLNAHSRYCMLRPGLPRAPALFRPPNRNGPSRYGSGLRVVGHTTSTISEGKASHCLAMLAPTLSQLTSTRSLTLPDEQRADPQTFSDAGQARVYLTSLLRHISRGVFEGGKPTSLIAQHPLPPTHRHHDQSSYTDEAPLTDCEGELVSMVAD